MINNIEIKKFNIESIKINPQIVMIAKRPTGKSWIKYRSQIEIEHELRIGWKKIL